MNFLFLNTWGGRVGQPLKEFILSHSDVDILCFQEVWSGGEYMKGRVAGGRVMQDIWYELLEDLAGFLPEHKQYFTDMFRGHYGLAMFVKKNIPVIHFGEEYVYREKGYISEADPGDHGRPLQYVIIETRSGPLFVGNFHGAWRRGMGKNDFDERLLQSDKIASLIRRQMCPVVLGGDFNLDINTESIDRIEASGLRNLIREFNIHSTRTKLYDHYNDNQLYADYTFVSQNITVKKFEVLEDVVSDHMPLYLELDYN
jgi:endonuclease/exonuclease/phosphatase family metal-dependent hydrolase